MRRTNQIYRNAYGTAWTFYTSDLMSCVAFFVVFLCKHDNDYDNTWYELCDNNFQTYAGTFFKVVLKVYVKLTSA
jgi:hypothetical protein